MKQIIAYIKANLFCLWKTFIRGEVWQVATIDNIDPISYRVRGRDICAVSQKRNKIGGREMKYFLRSGYSNKGLVNIRGIDGFDN